VEAKLAKKVTFTVFPEPLAGEYLTVADALNQILDLVEALERSESPDPSERQVVWRLTEAHTSSPPLTVTVESFPRRPDMAVAIEANRVAALFASELAGLLEGLPADTLISDAKAPISRVLARNLNGIARTEVKIDDGEPITVRPQSARAAQLALERVELAQRAAKPDWQRTEYGSIEGEIAGLTRWNGRPALDVVERLSEKRLTCVLSDRLSDELGPSHQWNEVWDGRRVLVTGALYYNSDGDLRRADIDTLKEMAWTDVPLSRLRGIDVLDGKTLAQHLAIMRG
jgi:hypothetical protein